MNASPAQTINRPKKASIITLGCKSNQYDSSAIGDMLLAGGVDTVEFPSHADAYVINTCTVTGEADAEARAVIRRARKVNPDAVVIVTGCYAQVAPDEMERISGIDYILGNPAKERILECVLKGRNYGAPSVELGDHRGGTPMTLRAFSSAGRTRINLKVQDGCDRNCSYCIIPKARGASKSLAPGAVEEEISRIAESGFKEIILTGIHLGAYGRDLGGRENLASMLEMIIKKDWPCRFRISSLDPDEATDGVIELLKDAKNICNHLHLCLQSGDDGILRKMNRPYTRGQFAGRVERLHAAIKDISIGVDVIAGFPGEGEMEFENTFSLLKDLPVSYLHVFPFSKRPGTPAAAFAGQVNGRTVKDRCLRLRELGAQKRDEFHRGFAGKEADVLLESARDVKTGLLKGKSRNYITVLVEGADAIKNTMVRVRLTPRSMASMRGIPL